MEKAKVVSAGHVCVDLTPAVACRPQRAVSDILVPGRLVPAGPLAVNPGGSVVNTGLAMQRFGADVTLMGKIGRDVLGRMLLGFLEEYGAGEGMIVEDSAQTSYSVVLALPGLDRIFIHNTGANDTFSAADIDYAALKDTVLFHFGYPPLMAQMYRDAGRELRGMFERICGLGVLTSLDMAALSEETDAGRADWTEILSGTLRYVDFFLPSFEEICFALDRNRFNALRDRAGGSDMTQVISFEEDAAPLADALIDMGCAVAMIKCGANGFWYRTAGEHAFAALRQKSGLAFDEFADAQGWVSSFIPDRVVSGTGAGDVTIGAFLSAVVQNLPLERCLDLAAAAGAACVEAVDALGSVPCFDVLEERIAAGWPRTKPPQRRL